MQAITLAFCDEDSLSRETIKILLKKIPYIHIIGEFENMNDILNLSKKNTPDIIICDLQSNTINDFIPIQKIISFYPNCKVIVVSTFEDYRTITTAFSIGVIGFLVKRDLSVSDLYNAINYSKENNHYVSRCCEYKMENISKLIQLNYSN